MFFAGFSFSARSSHITGGEMFYTFTGMINGQYSYNVTLKLFQRCGSGRQFPNPAIISIFNKTNNSRVTDISVTIGNQETISITNPDPCITNPPNVCYEVAYYNFAITLPASAAGYILASHVNYRISGINNLSSGYNNVGATYTADIPGNISNITAPVNNSAFFTGNDLVVVCANNNFSYSFAAQDTDGDSLRYSFCEAYNSTAPGGGTALPPEPPPFPPVPYNYPDFYESQPLGGAVQINAATGLITGIAPDVGAYVVTVCVEEIRNGIVIARQRKDIQINIADCDIAAASLQPEYLLCKNTQPITIANQSNSPLIVSTEWEFSDQTNTIIYTSADPIATYTFPAIGIYTVKLVINRNQTCSDSATALIRVFPGFTPGFTSSGICITNPTLFTDQTTSVYGTPNSWTWDFGETSSSNDFSSLQNPSYQYPQTGIKQARLIVTDTRGCRDTITKPVTIIDKPPIQLAFRDTLICRNDMLLLQAGGTGNFSWSPLVNITNPNTATPSVSPTVTTKYYVELNESGCVNKDSVLIRVVNAVSLQAMNDTTICKGDTIQLKIISDALQYVWTPGGQIINPAVKNPFVITNTVTSYQVTAIIGGCSAIENITVTPVPYPVVDAGKDVSICNNASLLLNGITDGSSWSWTPANRLSNASILNPIAFPPRTTDYILTVTDTKGCPKPVSDTIKVTVLPKMNVYAGADTAVIAGQPLQLNASGAAAYSWLPPDNLSASNIPNPVAIFNDESASFRYKLIGYNEEGCKDSAYIMIKVFKTGPTVFVPTGFTPNNDGKNDLLLPIAVGMKNIDYFNVYNRWGQLLFSTQVNGQGWDGKINGQLQATGTFVWSVKATDYTGKAYFQKGVATLIR